MNRIIMIVIAIFIALPYGALALDYTDCDAGTTQCTCTPDDKIGLDQTTITSIATCQEACIALEPYQDDFGGEVTGYSAQCLIGGTVTTLSQGGLDTAIGDSSDAIVGEPQETYDVPSLGVDIPGLQFTPAVKINGSVTSNYLGEYIEAVLWFLFPIASLLAVIYIMIGGLQYIMARGKADSISKATSRIRNAVVGVILLFGAVAMAQVVNPNFLKYESLNISYIDPQIYNDENKDLDFSFTIGTETAAYEASQGIIPGDILCDSSHTLEEVAQSTIGKITYRYGGKGDPPVYESETKTDSNGVPYSSYCPSGTVCYDCSGYASMIRQCVGLSGVGGTSSIFDSSAIKVTDYSTEGYINGIQLMPGDMIGRPSWHVWTYIGNGKWAESHADRDPGEAIAISGWSYPFGIMIPKYNEAYLKVSH
jgi:hypothetical protein